MLTTLPRGVCGYSSWRLTMSSQSGIAPGAVGTPINVVTMKDPVLMKRLDAAIPLGRMAKPEEIASVVAFLAGDGASYMTAITVILDGGMMQQRPGL